MKKILFSLIVFMVTIVMADERDINIEMQNLDHMTIPTYFRNAGIDVGVVIIDPETIFPIINATIPFGGDYLIHGGLGAGRDPRGENELTLISVGAGYKNRFPNNDIIDYLISAHIKTYQSSEYKTVSLTGEFDIEQKIDDDIFLGFGVLFGLEHYITNSTSFFGVLNDRTFSSMLKVSLIAYNINFQVKGSLNMLSMGVSYALNLDK